METTYVIIDRGELRGTDMIWYTLRVFAQKDILYVPYHIDTSTKQANIASSFSQKIERKKHTKYYVLCVSMPMHDSTCTVPL